MQALVAAALGLLFAASILVGIRLLVLHRRTGAAPELLLGGMLLLVCGVGYPLRIVSDRVSQEWLGTVVTVSDLAVGVGFALLFVFTWRVFRPEAGWARGAAAVGVMMVIGKALQNAIQIHSHGVVDIWDQSLAQILLTTGPMIAVYVWTSWESLRYHAMMRRRVKLGLADVAVSNRFLLWGLMAVSATAGVVVNTWAVALRIDTYNSPGILLFSAVSGLAQAILLVLALAPPRSYVRWVRSRAAAPSV
jgi:hypothetical protein